MSEIFFDGNKIIATIIHGCMSFTLAVKKSNKQSLAHVKNWIKNHHGKDVVLWNRKKPWIFFSCRIISHSEEDTAFFTKKKKYFSISIDYEHGDVITKDSEYRKTPWIKRARRKLLEDYKKV